MTVIQLKETSEWFDANLLKQSIAWMKGKNSSLFAKQIEHEEELLRSFFRKIKAQGDAASLSSVA